MKLLKIEFNTFAGGELSNDDYHAHPGISGTGLSSIFSKSVLSFVTTKRKPSDALGFGIASHANFLEPELFASEFYKGFDAELFPNAMSNQNHFKEYLSKHGLKVSGSKAEQIARIKDHAKHIEQHVQIVDDLRSEWDHKNKGLIEVKPDDFTQLNNMRDRLLQDPSVVNLIKGAMIERSIICSVDFFDDLCEEGEENAGQWVATVKIRPDIVSRGFALVDYKTCTDCYGKFLKDIFNLNYDLKMALQHDVLALVYNRSARVTLLAQNKRMPSELSNPHEYKPWILGDEILANGRKKYLVALKRWIEFQSTGELIGQGNGAEYVDMPVWAQV